MLDKAYDAKKYEDDIYKKWEESGNFTPEVDPNKKPFVISLPPPNATGTLHLGHAVMLALEDLMTRYKRMQGYSALWVPGTDHAAIATQNKVEKIIAEEGHTRHDLGREPFLDRVREFVAESQDTIRNQMRKMGSSCDWTRERYTFDEGLSHAVNEIFVRMYKDGLIYRGYRIVNWCPRCASTLADDEVEYAEQDAILYHMKYGPFEIATSRPETKLGDTAAAVHPDDDRYKEYIGQDLEIDLAGHKIKVKVIADEGIDREFGTGVLGVTPAHSFVDFEMAQKNDLEILQVINEKGEMTKVAGKYEGLDVLDCRKAFVEDLKKEGLITKEEPYKQNLSICYRCHHTIEPLMSRQWFIDVNKPIYEEGGKKKSIKEKSIELVKENEITIVPDRFNKTYFHWMEELRDWCISRQIWWGHRIPVWYCEDCEEIIVQHDTPSACTKCNSSKLQQDEDTLDTWFSSGLWTFSTLGWPEETEDLKYFHPTSVMETGYDILFFWVARMIIMSYYALNEKPFETVYLHGLIRCRDGSKMSKSKPETCIDPLEMIDKYGADALRLSLIIGSTPGNDTRLYEEKIAGFRNFVNKIWNSARFVLMNIEDVSKVPGSPECQTMADKWICSKLQKLIKDSTERLDKFQFSDVGQNLYDFLWRDFCDVYLEISKESKNESVIYYVLETLLKLLHPYTPFVTEVLWKELGKEDDLIVAPWPEVQENLLDEDAEAKQDLFNELIRAIRHLRSENKVEPAKMVDVILYGKEHVGFLEENEALLKKFGRVENLTITESGDKPEKAAASFVSGIEIYLPLAGFIDLDQEKKRLEKEIEDVSKYVLSVKNKLSNESFVSRAPAEVVDGEKQKLKEAEEKEKQLREQLAEL